MVVSTPLATTRLGGLLIDVHNPRVQTQRASRVVVCTTLQRQTALERKWHKALSFTIDRNSSRDAIHLDKVRTGRRDKSKGGRVVADDVPATGENIVSLVLASSGRVQGHRAIEGVDKGNAGATEWKADLEKHLALLILLGGRDVGPNLGTVAAQGNRGRLVGAAQCDGDGVGGAAASLGGELTRKLGPLLRESQGREYQCQSELHVDVE